MRFVSFLKGLPKQDDEELQSFINYVKRNKKFPLSSDPRMLGLYLHNKLDEKLTMGYMKAMMIYYHTDKNMLAKELKETHNFLTALNCIVFFQNEGV